MFTYVGKTSGTHIQLSPMSVTRAEPDAQSEVWEPLGQPQSDIVESAIAALRKIRFELSEEVGVAQ